MGSQGGMWCVHICICVCCRICCRDLTAYDCGGWLSSLGKAVIFISHAGPWSLWGRQWGRKDGCKLRKKQDKLEATAWAEAHENASSHSIWSWTSRRSQGFHLGAKHTYHPRVGKAEGVSSQKRNQGAFLFLRGYRISLVIACLSALGLYKIGMDPSPSTWPPVHSPSDTSLNLCVFLGLRTHTHTEGGREEGERETDGSVSPIVLWSLCKHTVAKCHKNSTFTLAFAIWAGFLVFVPNCPSVRQQSLKMICACFPILPSFHSQWCAHLDGTSRDASIHTHRTCHEVTVT